MDTLLNFKHYDIVAIVLFVFVFIGSGFLKQIIKQAKKEISTRKFYPELIDIYSKYFIVPRGFNPIGAIFTDEPIYISKRSPFVWDYKISWRLGLLYFCILFTGVFLAGIICFSYLVFKNQLAFPVVIIFIILSIIGVLIQKKLKNNILGWMNEFNKEVDVFLQSKSLTTEDVYLPPINRSKIVYNPILFSFWASLIFIVMFFVFYFIGL